MRDDLTASGAAARFKSDRAVGIARRLRKQMSPAETRLWAELRRLPLEGSHFRRQAVLGPFIADFLCHRAKLVIELDGGAHRAPDVALRDSERAAWIAGRGYRVLRFTNAEVLSDPTGVAHRIWLHASQHIKFEVMREERDGAS